jgi:hypothetical protein
VCRSNSSSSKRLNKLRECRHQTKTGRKAEVLWVTPETANSLILRSPRFRRHLRYLLLGPKEAG